MVMDSAVNILSGAAKGYTRGADCIKYTVKKVLIIVLAEK